MQKERNIKNRKHTEQKVLDLLWAIRHNDKFYFDNEIIEDSKKSLFSKYEILNNYFIDNNNDLFKKNSTDYFSYNTKLEQIKALGKFNEIVMLPMINKRIYFPFLKYLKGLDKLSCEKNQNELIDFIKRLHAEGLFNLFNKEIFENNLKLISKLDTFNIVRILNYQSSKEVIEGSITPQDLDLVLKMYNDLYETFGKLFIVIKGLNEIINKGNVEPLRFENEEILISKYQQKDIYPRFADLIDNGFPKQYSYVIDNLLRNNISHKSYKVDEKKAIIKSLSLQ